MSTQGVRNFKPKVHFTPPSMWSNDPNGMVYIDGIWHLYYQFHPKEAVWGPMHWGHAVSKDLLHWEHLPIALYPDELGYIFSGSMAYDKQNTSGFAKDGEIPMVAMYTSHRPEDGLEQQSIAYSLDGGFHFEKFYGNPVLENPDLSDFRDPKVFWNRKKECWSMILAAKDRAYIYASEDLKRWRITGEFGAEESLVKTTWECTDLFPVPGDEGEKWVLMVSMMEPKEHGWARIQYFVGDFDGDTFHSTESKGETLWLDFGFDNYAGVTFHNYRKPIYLGWGVNPAYANLAPTGEYAGLMTIARELKLVRTKKGYRIAATPFGIDSLRAVSHPMLDGDDLLSESFGLIVRGSGGEIVFKNQIDQKLIISVTRDTISVDRSQAGERKFSEKFESELYSLTKVERLESQDVNMEVLFDVSYLEVFADGGLETVSMVLYPDAPYQTLEISGDLKVEIYKLY